MTRLSSSAREKLYDAEATKAKAAGPGSCPCQPFSNAGAQQGLADDRHLWPVNAIVPQVAAEFIAASECALTGVIRS